MFRAVGYSYVQKKNISKSCDTPHDAIIAAIEIMGEGDSNASVITPDNKVFTSENWDVLRSEYS